MYNARPGLLIGFHGCEANTRNALLEIPDTIKKSEKPYDWLGHGMYFCFDLTDARFISMIKAYYSVLARTYKNAGQELPRNRDIKADKYKDKILRELDCKVIEFMHDQIIDQVADDIRSKGYSENKIFDSAISPQIGNYIKESNLILCQSN